MSRLHLSIRRFKGLLQEHWLPWGAVQLVMVPVSLLGGRYGERMDELTDEIGLKVVLVFIVLLLMTFQLLYSGRLLLGKDASVLQAFKDSIWKIPSVLLVTLLANLGLLVVIFLFGAVLTGVADVSLNEWIERVRNPIVFSSLLALVSFPIWLGVLMTSLNETRKRLDWNFFPSSGPLVLVFWLGFIVLDLPFGVAEYLDWGKWSDVGVQILMLGPQLFFLSLILSHGRGLNSASKD